MNKYRMWNFQTLIYADITTTEINWQNIVTYKVLFNAPFENEDEVLELLNYLEKARVEYMISCNWKDVTKESLSVAVWEICFSMDEDTYIFIQAFIQKIHSWSILSARVERTKWYVIWEIALLLPNK